MKLPDGWFLFGSLFWGESLSKQTVLSKGFYLDLPDVSSGSVNSLHRLQDQIRGMLGAVLSEGWAMQVQWSVDSDYRSVLEDYHARTERSEMSNFARYYRRFTCAALMDRMMQGTLRRERLAIFVSKKCSSGPKGLSGNREAIENVIRANVRTLEEKIGTLSTIFGDAKLVGMDDQEHYFFMRRFWNPSMALVAHEPGRRYEGFRPDDTILQTLRTDGIPRDIEDGVVLKIDDHYHSLFVLERWPQVSWPGIMRALTNAIGLEYSITQNVFPLSVEREINKAEKKITRLRGDAAMERKHSLLTSAAMLEEKVNALMQGFTKPFKALTVIRVWDRSVDGLIAKNAAIKAALQGMAGAQAHQVNQAAQFRNLLIETVPGWLGGKVREWDLYATSDYLPDLLPMSNTFTGHLDDAEALYEGAQGQVVGVRLFADGVPQHVLMTGMTGAGKSVAVIDLLTQTEGDYSFTAIIEEGMSYGVYTRTLGGEPIIIRPDGNLTINYLDTDGLPLTSGHVAMAAALCLKMIGADQSAEKNNRRTSMLSEYIHMMYSEAVEQWLKDQEDSAREQVARQAMGIERWRRERMHRDATFLDAFLEVRTFPEEYADLCASIDPLEVVRAMKMPESWRMVEALCIAKFTHEDFPRCGLTHAALVEMLRFTPFGHHDRSEAQYLATMLNGWSAGEGKYGKLFDGTTNINLRGRVAHFELGEIPESSKELKEAAGFLVSEYVRQHIVTLPRAQRKRIVFEEMARFLDVPEGGKIVAEAYAQLRKYGCLVISVTQQFSQLKKTPLFPVIRGNSKIFNLMRQQDQDEVEELGDAINLPPLARQPIKNYPLPEHQNARNRFSSYTYFAPEGSASVCGTVRVRASREMLYVASSNGRVFDERAKAIAKYPDVFDAILSEAENAFR